MPLLQMELTELEVEPLEVVEFSQLNQNSNLETLMSSKGEVASNGVLILKGLLPRNDNGCCCYAPFQCCGCCANAGQCCPGQTCCCCPDPNDPAGRPWSCDRPPN